MHKLLPFFFSPSAFIPLFLPAKPSSEVETERLRGHRESWNHPSIHPSAMRRGFKGRRDFFLFFLLFFLFILLFSFQGSAGWIQVKRKLTASFWACVERNQLGFLKKNVVVFLLSIYFSAFLAWNKKRERSGAAFSRSCIFLRQDYSSTSPVTLQSGRSRELFWRKYDCKDTNKGKEDWIKNVYFFTIYIYIYR